MVPYIPRPYHHSLRSSNIHPYIALHAHTCPYPLRSPTYPDIALSTPTYSPLHSPTFPYIPRRSPMYLSCRPRYIPSPLNPDTPVNSLNALARPYLHTHCHMAPPVYRPPIHPPERRAELRHDGLGRRALQGPAVGLVLHELQEPRHLEGAGAVDRLGVSGCAARRVTDAHSICTRTNVPSARPNSNTTWGCRDSAHESSGYKQTWKIMVVARVLDGEELPISDMREP